MKKLLLLLLFIPLMSFGQDNVTVVQSKTSVSSKTNIENELVLSDEKTSIKTFLTADLGEYTHILIVDSALHIDRGELRGLFRMYDDQVEELQNILSLTVFEIMNPYEVNKKRAKKEPNFLKTIKNESYLYLYVRQGKGRGDDINTSIVVRDWKNKQIYNATHINTGLNEILAPLIDY